MKHSFDEFITDPELLLATVAELFDAGGSEDLGDLIRAADLSIQETGYDNWNGGMSLYTASIQVPVSSFPPNTSDVERIERSIFQKLIVCTKHCSNQSFEAVLLQPKIVKGRAWRRKGKPLNTTASDELAAEIWTDDCFKLFLSHSSANKKQLAKVKLELATFGISSFLAHEDITPSQEWLNCIEVALMSCNALAAFITDEFRASHWTDQEVGIAVGQGVFVLPVKVGKDPYGFIGKVQAVNGWWEKPEDMAKDIARALLVHRETSTAMKAALVKAVEEAGSYDRAKLACSLAMTCNSFTKEQLARLLKAATNNSQVRDANFGKLGDRMSSWVLEKAPELKPVGTLVVDDFDPFGDE